MHVKIIASPTQKRCGRKCRSKRKMRAGNLEDGNAPSRQRRRTVHPRERTRPIAPHAIDVARAVFQQKRKQHALASAVHQAKTNRNDEDETNDATCSRTMTRGSAGTENRIHPRSENGVRRGGGERKCVQAVESAAKCDARPENGRFATYLSPWHGSSALFHAREHAPQSGTCSHPRR